MDGIRPDLIIPVGAEKPKHVWKNVCRWTKDHTNRERWMTTGVVQCERCGVLDDASSDGVHLADFEACPDAFSVKAKQEQLPKAYQKIPGRQRIRS